MKGKRNSISSQQKRKRRTVLQRVRTQKEMMKRHLEVAKSQDKENQKTRKHPSNSIITVIRSLEANPMPNSTSTRIVHSKNVQMPNRQMVVSGFSGHFNEPSNASSTASSAMSSSSSNSTSGSSLSLSSSRAARGSYSSSSSSLSPRTVDILTSNTYKSRPNQSLLVQSTNPLVNYNKNGNKASCGKNGGILKNGSGSMIAVPVIVSRDASDSPSPPPLPPRTFNFSKNVPNMARNNIVNNRFDSNMNKRPPPPLPLNHSPDIVPYPSEYRLHRDKKSDNFDKNESTIGISKSLDNSTASSSFVVKQLENVQRPSSTGIKHQAVSLSKGSREVRFDRHIAEDSHSSMPEEIENDSDMELPPPPTSLPPVMDLSGNSDMGDLEGIDNNFDVNLPLPPPPLSRQSSENKLESISSSVLRLKNGSRHHRSHHLPSSSSSASSSSSVILSQSSSTSPSSPLSPAEGLLKKSEQVTNLTRVLESLKMEEVSLQRDFESNESLGSQLLNKLCNLGLSTIECDKITTHCDEIDKVTRLLLSLSSRLRDVEMTLQSKSLRSSDHPKQKLTSPRNSSCSPLDDCLKSTGTSMPVILSTLTDYDIEDALMNGEDDDHDSLLDSLPSSSIKLPENLNDYPEIQLLINKRSKLLTQVEEALILKESIDRRSEVIGEKILKKYFKDKNDIINFIEFMKLKSKLIVESREVKDQLEKSEKRLHELEL